MESIQELRKQESEILRSFLKTAPNRDSAKERLFKSKKAVLDVLGKEIGVDPHVTKILLVNRIVEMTVGSRLRIEAMMKI